MRRSLISLASGVLAACSHPAAPAPPPACTDAAIASQDDVARYTSCTSLASLTIRTGAAVDLTPLARLASIDKLVIGPSIGVEEVRLTALRTAGSISIASNASLHGIYLPALERAGTIAIEANADLSTVVLAHLAEVSGAMHVSGNSVLEMVDISALAKVGQLVMADNPTLTILEADKLPAEAVDALRPR